MWPLLFLCLLLYQNSINWENRLAIEKAILKPLEWTKNLKVLTNQQMAIVQTLGTIYKPLGTNGIKISAIISYYNNQSEIFTHTSLPQITKFASKELITQPRKLDFEKSHRKKSKLKITRNENNKFSRYQLLEASTKTLLHQYRTKFNKNSITRILDIGLVGVAVLGSATFDYDLHNLRKFRPTTTTFDMNGPNFATELSVENFQRHYCFLEKKHGEQKPSKCSK